MPAISDNNNNLLAYISYINIDNLKKVLNMPMFEQFYRKEKKMFPIFFNFFGESQLNMALLANDHESFYRLQVLFVKM